MRLIMRNVTKHEKEYNAAAYHDGFVMRCTFLPTTRAMLDCSIGAFASSNTLDMTQSCRKHSFVDSSRQSHACRTLKKVEVNAAGGHSKGNEQQLHRPQPRQLVASSPSENATCWDDSTESTVRQSAMICAVYRSATTSFITQQAPRNKPDKVNRREDRYHVFLYSTRLHLPPEISPSCRAWKETPSQRTGQMVANGTSKIGRI
jgi:hypothetical protein